MIRAFAGAVAMLLEIMAPLPTSAIDEKSPDECTKYLDQMTSELDTLEALVPNVPPEEAGYIEKSIPHPFNRIRDSGFIISSIVRALLHGTYTTHLISHASKLK